MALAVAPALINVPVAQAQPAAALGKPLPDGSMDAGSVSVRVVAGSPASPVIGAEVTLLVGDSPRVARTDASGRAVFPGLTAGATVRAKIKNAEGNDLTSDPFPVPSAGGMRVMLSTKPFTGGAGPSMSGGGGGGPAAGGGMPEARQMSGQPRPDQETPSGTYVVRLTYNSLEMVDGRMTDKAPPIGESVTLVGYVADDSVVVHTTKVDAEGYATFQDLDVSGATGYFALATLPRGAGVDRMFGMPTQLTGQAGIRTVLSGEKRDSTAPNIDALATQHAIATPVGKVRVTLEGFPSPSAPIRIIDATTKKVVAEGTSAVMEGDPTTVQGGSKYEPKADVPAGTLDVFVHGGVGADAPLGEIEIRIIAADAKSLEGVATKTGADGNVRVTAPAATGQQRAVFRVLGRDFVSEPFDLTKSGGKLDIKAQWSSEGRPQGIFDLPYQAGQVLYAETTVTGKLEGTYRSMPFQPIPQAGTHVGIIVYPRIMFKFNMRAFIEDQLLAVQGRFTIENNSWTPYRANADGMLIPLPKGFKGGVIAEMNQADVAVVPGEGFRVMRPLAPGGGTSFVGGFSMSVDGGAVDWKLDLPLGTFGSDLHIRETPGMTVKLPEGVRGQVKAGKDGNPYFMVEQITIPKGTSMTMSVHGLPSPPTWKIWVPRIVGILVVMVMLGGIGLALASKRTGAVPGMSARRGALLDELVELERTGKDPRRKEQVLAELEKLWGS
jgi:hypothetical protein